MQYLNDSFWRMVAGLMAVLVLGVAFLAISQAYNSKVNDNISPENYLAGSKDKP